MSYDAILLDFDGVLVELPSRESLRDAIAGACDRAGLDEVRAVAAAARRGDFATVRERCRAAGTDPAAFRSTAVRSIVRTQVEAVEAGLRSAYDDVAALRSVDRPLGVVSDNHPVAVRAVLDRIGLRDRMGTVRGCPFTPEGFDRRKPDPANVEAAMADLGAESALYVGDRPVDVAAARNAGIDAALVERDHEGGSPLESPDCADSAPDYRVPSLSALVALL